MRSVFLCTHHVSSPCTNPVRAQICVAVPSIPEVWNAVIRYLGDTIARCGHSTGLPACNVPQVDLGPPGDT